MKEYKIKETSEDWKRKLPLWIVEGLFEEVTDDRGTRTLGYVRCSDRVLKEFEKIIESEKEKSYKKGWEDCVDNKYKSRSEI